MANDKVSVTFRMEANDKDRLEQYAKSLDMSLSAVIRVILRDFMNVADLSDPM